MGSRFAVEGAILTPIEKVLNGQNCLYRPKDDTSARVDCHGNRIVAGGGGRVGCVAGWSAEANESDRSVGSLTLAVWAWVGGGGLAQGLTPPQIWMGGGSETKVKFVYRISAANFGPL